jgi:hypothetical protein
MNYLIQHVEKRLFLANVDVDWSEFSKNHIDAMRFSAPSSALSVISSLGAFGHQLVIVPEDDFFGKTTSSGLSQNSQC